MSFTPLKALLPQAIRHAGLEKSVGATEVIEEAVRTLRILWPSAQADFVRPVSFANGTLVVAVRAPAAAHALRASATVWMNAMNQAFNGKRVVSAMTVRREGF